MIQQQARFVLPRILSKNILGTFYLPQLVFCISETFLTLLHGPMVMVKSVVWMVAPKKGPMHGWWSHASHKGLDQLVGLIVEMCSNRFSGIGRVQNQVEHLKLISKHGYLWTWISEDIWPCGLQLHTWPRISMNQQLHPPRSKCSVHAAVGEACKTCLEYDIRSGIDLSTSGAPGSSPT